MILKRLFSRVRAIPSERRVYEAIVAQARQPGLYARLRVPDTLDGRFDMIILHADAVIVHMQSGDAESRDFAQNLIDEVFRDMDRSLREMGVGDMGVGKRVKKMATVYFGRAKAYSQARAGQVDEMSAALLRNVYGGDGARAADAVLLAEYAGRLCEVVAGMDRSAIAAGELDLSGVPVT